MHSALNGYLTQAKTAAQSGQIKITPNSKMLTSQRAELSVTFGDAEMTYLQFIIVQDNAELLRKVIEQPQGRQDFLKSRD